MKDVAPQVRNLLRPLIKLENELVRDAATQYGALIDDLKALLSSSDVNLAGLRGRLDAHDGESWIRQTAPLYYDAISKASVIGRQQVRDQVKDARQKRRRPLQMADVPDLATFDFNVANPEARAWFELQSFSIAHVEHKELTAFAKEMIDFALDEGLTFSQWLDGLNEMFDAAGVTRRSKFHLQTVFQTNVQTAFNASRWAAYSDPDVAGFFPYYQYHAVDDGRTRPAHLANNGAIYRRDDPFWLTWWPPNGYNCRCTVTAVSKYEAEDYGIEPGEIWGVNKQGDLVKMGNAMPKGLYEPDIGFDSHPADGSYFEKWAREKGVDLDEIEKMYMKTKARKS